MSRTLDFNTVAPQTLTLVMRDEAKTVIEVGIPNEHLVEQLQAMQPQINNMQRNPDKVANRELYELAARFINCNYSGITVTAEELRDKYHMNLELMTAFYHAYVEFISDLTNEKN